MQMVFDSREDADKAMAELKSGKDFYVVAKETAGQDKETTDLGYVAKDLLIADMAEDVFAIRKGEIAGPAKSDLGWHIMKVTDIKAGSKADKAEARRKIVETLKKNVLTTRPTPFRPRLKTKSAAAPRWKTLPAKWALGF